MTVELAARITDIALNIVIVAHSKPAGSLFPGASPCSVAEPISEFKVAISVKSLPMLKAAIEGRIDVAMSELPSRRSLFLPQIPKSGP